MAEKKTVKKKTETAKKKAPAVKKEKAVKAPKVEKEIKEKPAVATVVKEEPIAPVVHKPKVHKAPKVRLLPKENVFEGTGRRKTAMAHVYLYKGTGKILINSKPYEEYFCRRQLLLNTLLRPLKEINALNAYDILVKAWGGGVPAQADAVRMGIARALVAMDAENRKILRSLDLLRRDPRVKERKKYGLKRARRAFQYTKR